MSVASNLVDSFVANEKAKQDVVMLDVGSGVVAVSPEMARKCVEQGIGKIIERRKSLFGFEPH
jgi:hypothetical protein